MSLISTFYDGPAVVGVMCRQGHFEEGRRRLSTPLFPVGLATVGVIFDFLILLPNDIASLYLPIAILNFVGAWLAIVFVTTLRNRFYPLPERCPVCDGPLEGFRGSVDPKNGPNAIEVSATLLFIFQHIIAAFIV